MTLVNLSSSKTKHEVQCIIKLTSQISFISETFDKVHT